MRRAVLVVVAGRPGTGKTTLARSLVVELGAAYLRVDAAETAVESVTGRPAGVAGYAVVWQMARTNLLLGAPVVVDAVCPVAAARSTWRDLGHETGARVLVLETALDDEREHRRRVEERRPDMPGQRVPTWPDVLQAGYEPWEEARNGPRTVIGTADAGEATRSALRAVLLRESRDDPSA